jgi:hypothetical protein
MVLGVTLLLYYCTECNGGVVAYSIVCAVPYRAVSCRIVSYRVVSCRWSRWRSEATKQYYVAMQVFHNVGRVH